MTEVEDSQEVLPENQQQVSTQESILQAQAGVIDNVTTPATTDFSGLIALDPIDVLQKEIDEIAERRRIALLRETLRKAKADEEAGFCAPARFDGTLTLPICPEDQRNTTRDRVKI